jgi:hypothetical protein
MSRLNRIAAGPDPAFLVASLLHFYSGQPLQNLSGVDISKPTSPPPLWERETQMR